MAYKENILRISATVGRNPLLSVLLPATWFSYDGDPTPIIPRVSRAHRYPPDMATDIRNTEEPQYRRDTKGRDRPPRGRDRPPKERERPSKERDPQSLWHHRSFVFIVIGMVIMLLLFAIAQIAGGWVTNTIDNVRYGDPRTFQTDEFVGHENGQTPSHFTVINLHGRIEITEFPGGDGTKAKTYQGPQLYDAHAEQVPVTIHFVDTHHNHHPDMYVQFDTTQIVFRNTGTAFQTP